MVNMKRVLCCCFFGTSSPASTAQWASSGESRRCSQSLIWLYVVRLGENTRPRKSMNCSSRKSTAAGWMDTFMCTCVSTLLMGSAKIVCMRAS